MKTTLVAAALAVAVGAVTLSSIANAQQGGPGAGPGPEYGRGAMMDGYGGGPGMMGGPGSGAGWGPGMVRGGTGWGGPGFGGPLALADLTDEQREKIARIQEDNRAKNWSTMGQMRSEQFKLRQMYFTDKVDANAYAEQQRKVDELRRSMLKTRVEARNQIGEVLTKEQRQQFRSFGPWWLQDGGME